MMVGIVAEGPSDVAVLRNVLRGWLGIDGSDTIAIRPDLSRDETDKAELEGCGYASQRPEQYSNWALVLEECRRRSAIEGFLRTEIDESRCVVIQIDTAECEEPAYGIPRPNRRAPDYHLTLRQLVVKAIDGLLGTELAPFICHAVAIEETEEWLLPLHDAKAGTARRQDPKKRLEHVLNKKKESRTLVRDSRYDTYDQLSRPFRKRKTVADAAAKCPSLKSFLESLDGVTTGDR